MIKPLLLATLPIYAIMSLMTISAIAVYEIAQDIAVNYPSYSLSAFGLVFFLFFMMLVIGEVLGVSRLATQHNLRDVRVQLPMHWRSVILDIVSWARHHAYVEILSLFGFIGVFSAVSEVTINTLRAIQAPVPAYWIVILVGMFVGLFAFATCQVLYRSALAPINGVTEEGLDALVDALPQMSARRIELLKKERSSAISPRAMRLLKGLYGLAALALGVSAAAPFVGFPFLTIPCLDLAAITMVLGMIVMLSPIIGKKESILSRALRTDEQT